MNVTLKKIYIFLFFLGVFFIPFNSFEGVKQLGEFKRESGAYFFLLAFFVVLLDFFLKKKISFPLKNKVLVLILVFLVWTLFSIAFNLPFVLESYYKKTTGLNRFGRQFFALILSSVVFFTVYWNMLKSYNAEEILIKLRRIFFYSFLAVSIYGFFEILFIVFGISSSKIVLDLFDFFPFTEFDVDSSKRISSVSYEPPALATFLITVSGWMFSYILTGKNILKYIPTIVVIILTYFSGSRTALIVVFIQLFVFLWITLSRNKMILSAMVLCVFFFLASITVFFSNSDKILSDVGKKMESLDFKSNLKKNISNQSRFGIQYANLVVFSENPLLGVGFGQQGYHAINHYPIWAKKNNYEFDQIYLNKSNPMFPPGYNLYIRILAEMGMVGFCIFGVLIFTLIKESNNLRKSKDVSIRILGIITLVSFLGFILNFMQLDTFRIYGFWICIAVLIRLMFLVKSDFVK